MKSRGQLPHLYYPRMNQTRIINAHRSASGGGGATFGNASREFDGANDYINLGDASKFLDGAAYTISFWMKATSLINYDGICSADESSPFDNWINWRTANGINFEHRTSISSGSSAISLSTWHHVVASFSATNGTRLVVDDDTPVTNGSETTQLNTGSKNFYVGLEYHTTFGRNYHGLLADFRIYDREITGAEITDLNGMTDVTSGLVGHYFLNTDDVLDYSGNGNDGTNFGSTYSTDGPFD